MMNEETSNTLDYLSLLEAENMATPSSSSKILITHNIPGINEKHKNLEGCSDDENSFNTTEAETISNPSTSSKILFTYNITSINANDSRTSKLSSPIPKGYESTDSEESSTDGSDMDTSPCSTPAKAENSGTSSASKALVKDDSKQYIDRRVAKYFGDKLFFGTVTGCNMIYWRISYDDGDKEDMDVKELHQSLKLYTQHSVKDSNRKRKSDVLINNYNKVNIEQSIQSYSDDDEEYVVEQLLDCKIVDDERYFIFLIKWKDYPESENSWEPYDSLSPQLHSKADKLLNDKFKLENTKSAKFLSNLEKAKAKVKSLTRNRATTDSEVVEGMYPHPLIVIQDNVNLNTTNMNQYSTPTSDNYREIEKVRGFLQESEKWFQSGSESKDQLQLAMKSIDNDLYLTKELEEFFHINPKQIEQNSVNKKLNEILKSAFPRIEKFNSVQEQTCLRSCLFDEEDIVLLAPTGLGKSLCFQVPTIYQKGVTIVIEPLKAIIDNQIDKLKSIKNIIKAIQLQSKEDVKNKSGIHGISMSKNLASQYRNQDNPTPLLIYATPELLVCIDEILKNLAQLPIKRIVFDEFDVSADSSRGKKYEELLRKLLNHFPDVPFMFLSATTSRTELMIYLKDLLQSRKASGNKPSLFIHKRPISDALSFHVEGKMSDEQVAKRIKYILAQAKKKQAKGSKIKAICYCLTKSSCKDMAQHLQSQGISAEYYFSSKENGEIQHSHNVNAIQQFKKGKLEIICATNALGRGFDSDDLRFIFHCHAPLSLRDYVQQTGRGGRDKKECTCILFYRPQDRSKAENIVCRTSNGPKTNMTTEQQQALDDVRDYCLSSDRCRYDLLSQYLLKKKKGDILTCNQVKCDHCLKDKQYINYDMGRFLSNIFNKPDKYAEIDINQEIKESIIIDGNKTKFDNDAMSYFKKGSFDSSPRSDLVRLLASQGVVKKSAESWSKVVRSHETKTFLEDLNEGKKKVFLKIPRSEYKHSVPDNYIDGDNNNQVAIGDLLEGIDFNSGFDLDSDDDDSENTKLCHHDFTNYPDGSNEWVKHLPFLLQFEISRLYQDNLLSADSIKSLKIELFYQHLNLYDKLHRIYEASGRNIPTYEKVVKSAVQNNISVDSTESLFSDGAFLLYFSARLDEHGKITYLPVEYAHDRRIYRKYGSHRFLNINVGKNVNTKFIKNQFYLFGRKYRFLWAKHTKTPQSFIYFAESGQGIDERKKLRAKEVRNWCIPLQLNKDLTLGKELKRMKLSFSKTTATKSLPEKCVEVVDDIIDENNNVRSDGCGLISRDGLDYVWKSYCRVQERKDVLMGGSMKPPSEGEEEEEEEDPCPYSSFQGRLGGFKGMWVLDESLGSGIKVICRQSQLKYNCPMKCIVNNMDSSRYAGFDVEFYDSFDINSWDDKVSDGHLSIRLIQILEERGVSYEYFQRIANKSIDLVSNNLVDNSSVFKYMCTMSRPKVVSAESDEIQNDSIQSQLRKLAQYELYDEPHFQKKMKQYKTLELQNCRDKARYNLGYYIRLLPDHKGLLKEGEGFLALEGKNTRRVSETVAMRNPAYFRSDVIKITIVTLETLKDRIKNKDYEEVTGSRYDGVGEDPLSFYKDLKVGLVLNIRGSSCMANMMSGGDFDGDEAWVCYNQDLVSNVKTCEQYDTSKLKPDKSYQEEKVVDNNTADSERIELVKHYHYHQQNLGKLSKYLDRCIDRLGFDHPISKEIGEKLFLQVDHPYKLCELKSDTEKEMKHIDYPHWFQGLSPSQSTHNSEKYLGRLYNLVDKAIKEEKESVSQKYKLVTITKFLEYMYNQQQYRDYMKTLSAKAEEVFDYYKNQSHHFEERSNKEKSNIFHKNLAQKVKEMLIDCQEEETLKNLAAALLYDKCTIGHVLPWEVAADRLGKIHLEYSGVQIMSREVGDSLLQPLTKRRRKI